MGGMRLEDKIGQMLMVGFYGLEAPDYLLNWLHEGRIGGVILFARNIESPAQVARLTASIHQAAKYPVLIGIDQEGGTVARLRQGFTESPGAMALSAAAEGVKLAERIDHMLAAELSALGINWDFAPAVDVAYNPSNPAVGTRSFGADAADVAKMGAAAVRGFQSGGVAACAKHFPGLGNTAVDTHLALPVLDTSIDHLLKYDMLPFRDAIGAGIASIMTTHTIFSALDTSSPATLSPVIIHRLLREELDFDRVVTSDCMEMKAISDHVSPGETAVLAALAGIDIILFSHTRAMQEQAYESLLSAVNGGHIPMQMIDAANRRIAAMKSEYPAKPLDISVIRQPAHLELALEAACAGTVLLKDNGLLPIRQDAVLVEFASQLDSGILESGGMTGLGVYLHQYFPQMPMIAVAPNETSALKTEQSQNIIRSSHTLVLATRSAHLNPFQLEAAHWLMSLSKHTILVCLRNPYDASLLFTASTIICTCGDSDPSLQAAAAALAGKFVPSGTLPVPVIIQ